MSEYMKRFQEVLSLDLNWTTPVRSWWSTWIFLWSLVCTVRGEIWPQEEWYGYKNVCVILIWFLSRNLVILFKIGDQISIICNLDVHPLQVVTYKASFILQPSPASSRDAENWCACLGAMIQEDPRSRGKSTSAAIIEC
jgi:hypothetical protein